MPELKIMLVREEAVTKTDGGKNLAAKDYAYVGDPEKPTTWKLRIDDEAHVRDALARFDQAELPEADKKKVARKLVRKAKAMGIDASGFAKEYGVQEAGVVAGDAVESIEDRLDELSRAVDAHFGVDEHGWSKYSVIETFPNYVITRGPDGELYQIKFSVDESTEEFVFGDPVQVETAYVPVTECASFVTEAQADATDPLKYKVVAIKAGWGKGSLNGVGVPHYYTQETVSQVAQMMNGAKFGRCHPAVGDGSNEPERIAGWFENGELSGSEARATLQLLATESDLAARLDAARKAGKLGDLFGLSINGYVGFTKGRVEGREAMVSSQVAKLASVDLVGEAGAGGRFLVAASKDTLAEISAMQTKAVRSINNGGSAVREEEAMRQLILQVLEALRQKDAGRANALAIELASLSDDKLPGFVAKVTEALNAAPSIENKNDDATAKLVKEANDALAQAQTLTANNRIEQKLRDSKLPAAAAKLVKEHLTFRVVADAKAVTDEVIDGEIKSVRESFAAFSSVGRIHGSIEVGDSGADALQKSMDATFGVKEAITGGAKPFKFRGVPSLTAGYVACTGDSELSFGRGVFAVREDANAVATSDFPNILLNAMTKRIIQDYNEVPMGGVDRLYTTTTVNDYKTQYRVRMGYLGDLPVVAEEGTYGEVSHMTDEQISYAPSKRGYLLSVTEETIRNDDLGKVAQFPSRMARAARRTLKQIVTNFFLNNPNYIPDGVAWFNAAHSNLLATPLSIAALQTARTNLKLQTEKDSNKPLNLPLQFLMFRPDLWGTAIALNQTDKWPTGPGTFTVNPFFHAFGANNEGMIENELLTYANDWYYGCFASEVPVVEVGFLGGFETPQMYINNNPANGSVPFTKDEIQYKVKHVYGAGILDFRGVGYSANH